MGRKYEFIRELGSGGMSVVYLARDKKLSMRWTIKKIDVSGGEHIAESVKREALALRRLRTDKIARLADIYREGNYICLCMEYVEGRNLREMIRYEPESVRKNLLKWTEELTDILLLLHSMNPPLIYRDMKPGNVIVKPDGKLCLIDFGAARLKSDAANDDSPTGTKAYAPPEQFLGFADERSDIYALGRTIEKLAGKRIPFGLGKIISKATEDDPVKRYQSVLEMKKALKRLKFYKKAIPAAAVIIVMLAAGISGMRGIAARTGNYREEIRSEKEENLRLLIDNGKTDEALGKIDEYLIRSDGSDNSKLCYEAGLAAFFELSDYEKAGDYFAAVDKRIIPEASFLKNISEELSVISEDKTRLIKAIEDYRKFSRNKEDNRDKLSNLLYIAKTEYMISPLVSGDIKNELLKKALDDVRTAQEIAERISADAEYESKVHDLKYLLLKDMGFEEDALEEGNEWLETADGRRDKGTAVKRILEMDEIYERSGDVKSRLDFLEKAEKIYPFDLEEIYIRHLELLINRGEKKEKIAELFGNARICGNLAERKEYKELEKKFKDKYKEKNHE